MGAYKILRQSEQHDGCWVIDTAHAYPTKEAAQAAVGRTYIFQSKTGPVLDRWDVVFDRSAPGDAKGPESPPTRGCPCAACRENDKDGV